MKGRERKQYWAEVKLWCRFKEVQANLAGNSGANIVHLNCPIWDENGRSSISLFCSATGCKLLWEGARQHRQTQKKLSAADFFWPHCLQLDSKSFNEVESGWWIFASATSSNWQQPKCLSSEERLNFAVFTQHTHNSPTFSSCTFVIYPSQGNHWPQSCQYLIWSVFNSSPSSECLVLICISLMTNDEHILMCLLSKYLLWWILLQFVFCPFLNWVVYHFCIIFACVTLYTAHTYRLIIHIKLVFVYDTWFNSKGSLCHMWLSIVPASFVGKDCSPLNCLDTICWKSINHVCVGLFLFLH